MLEQEIKRIWETDADHYDALIKGALSDKRHVTSAWAELILSWAPHEGPLQILGCGTGQGFSPVALGKKATM